MPTPEEILKKTFGYDAFRPLQKEIIENILNGNDTIALLATGGGKSLCFQVPALIKEGICLVITPLIALMKDQAENLKRRDIQALAIYSGMSRRELEFELENCVNGKYKFLYLSPERLMSEHFISYARHMDISFLVVDEAHCISQWGYDFRPPYLKIAEFLNLYTKLTCMALTASATPEVVGDIAEKLGMRKATVFNSGFTRPNLSYVVRHAENKQKSVADICLKMDGTGLVYVNSRKKTSILAEILQKKGISCDFYHAGLEAAERARKQDDWKAGRTRVMVCTNAFGMGIDKPDVRFVIHESRPDTPEAYYQEAGRAGRDGKKSYCVLLWHEADFAQDEKTAAMRYPSSAEIKRVYEAICNYLKVAVGSGKGEYFDFEIQKAAAAYRMDPRLIFNSLRLLESEGYFSASESVFLPSRMKILCSYNELYEWQLQNGDVERIFTILLRSYGGLFDFYTNIYESDIARRLKQSEKWVRQQLLKIHSTGIIDYVPQTGHPQLLLLEHRFSELYFPEETIRSGRKRFLEKLKEMNRFIQNDQLCRSVWIAAYFGEKKAKDCGICDVCLARKNKTKTSDFREAYQVIRKNLHGSVLQTDSLREKTDPAELNKVLHALRWLADNGYVTETEPGIWKMQEVKEF